MTPKYACLAFGALALWYLGYPDQPCGAFTTRSPSPRSCRTPSRFALAFADWLHQLRREGQAAKSGQRPHCPRNRPGVPFWGAWGTILRGWALAEQGQSAEGIAQMCQGIAAYRATGAELQRPYYLAPVGGGVWEGRAGRRGLRVLAEALMAVHTRGGASPRG